MGIRHAATIVASLCFATGAAATTPGPGGTQITTAHATYSVSLHTFDDPTGVTRSGTGFGAETISIPDSLAVTHAEFGSQPSGLAYASAYYDNASGSGHGFASNTLNYAFNVKAANPAATAVLAAYLLANNGVAIVADFSIYLSQNDNSYGDANGSVDLGADVFSVDCQRSGGPGCGLTNSSVGGRLVAGTSVNTFSGFAHLTADVGLREGGPSFGFGSGCGGGLGGGGGGATGPYHSPCYNPGRNAVYAYVDPVISLASGFTSQPGYNPADYTIEFSPGVAAVPEPAAWALLIMGFGAVGAVQRRRSYLRAVAA